MSDIRYPLFWRAPPLVESTLPAGVKRTYIRTPNGRLELLIAQPSPSVHPRKKALLFQHGGFGSASVWIPFLLYFSQKCGHPCYAASLRGHGASWNPGYLKMVFGTGKASMAQDLGFVLNYVQGFESGQRGGEDGVDEADIVLVGHSAGGGLSQYFLSRGWGQVGGLVLVASFPNFGGLGVYWNWFKLDPFFSFRMYLRDLGHPRSPLSSIPLIHRAFFSPEFPRESVAAFEPNLSAYESLRWPLGMMLPFVNVRNVLRHILGWGSGLTARVLVVAGGEDTLMGVVLMRRMAEEYRKRFIKLVRSSEVAVADQVAGRDERTSSAVDFVVIEGAGHHVQNDLQWEEAASRILEFVEKL